MCKGKRPIGAAKGKQTNTMASCQPPPPPSSDFSPDILGGGSQVTPVVPAPLWGMQPIEGQDPTPPAPTPSYSKCQRGVTLAFIARLQ